WQLFHTYAWHEVLSFFGHRLSLGRLYKIKMIAEALNMLVPSGNIGGDTLRAHLLRDYAPLSDGIPSVMIDKTLEFITKLLFNIAGFSIALFFIDIPATWFWGCVIYLSLIFVFYALLVLVQVKGISGWMLRLTQLIPPLHRGLEKRKKQLQALDSNLKAAYTQGRLQLLMAAIWHTIGRMLGVLEIWLILWLLGASTNFVEVFFVAAVVNVVNGVFVLIPGQWGVSEGAQLMLVKLLGYSDAIGLSMGIIRRIRRLLLAGVGMVIFVLYRKNEGMMPENISQSNAIAKQ
ncbi:MAG: lysylphosphatidylglycerol synthase domain-containing protein, partial [Bacteroidota bacterium]